MAVVMVDYDTFQEIIKKNNECIKLEEKIAKLARSIDLMHINGQKGMSMSVHPKLFTYAESSVNTIEEIAKKMERLFQVTVLTSPRD